MRLYILAHNSTRHLGWLGKILILDVWTRHQMQHLPRCVSVIENRSKQLRNEQRRKHNSINNSKDFQGIALYIILFAGISYFNTLHLVIQSRIRRKADNAWDFWLLWFTADESISMKLDAQIKWSNPIFAIDCKARMRLHENIG